MQKQILLFSVSQEKRAILQQICEKLDWTASEIDKNRYNETLGALLGLPAGIHNVEETGLVGIYKAMGFPVEMIVFCGIDDSGLNTFLREYKETGARPIPLKAMLTPYNISWSAVQLFEELMKEHQSFQNRQ